MLVGFPAAACLILLLPLLLVLTDQEENVFDHRAPASCASKPPFVLQGDAQSLDSQTIRMFKGPVQQQRLCLRNSVLVILHSWDSRSLVTLVFRKQKAWGWSSDKPWKCSLAPWRTEVWLALKKPNCYNPTLQSRWTGGDGLHRPNQLSLMTGLSSAFEKLLCFENFTDTFSIIQNWHPCPSQASGIPSVWVWRWSFVESHVTEHTA